MPPKPSSFDEAKDYVLQVLEENNTLAKIQADIRAAVSSAVLSTSSFKSHPPSRLSNPDIRSTLSLIYEFLDFFDLSHTSSILSKELNDNHDHPTRSDLISTHLAPRSLNPSSNEPVLVTLISKSSSHNSPPSIPPQLSPRDSAHISPASDRSPSPPSQFPSNSPFSPSHRFAPSSTSSTDLTTDIPKVENNDNASDHSPPSLHPSPLPPSPLTVDVDEGEAFFGPGSPRLSASDISDEISRIIDESDNSIDNSIDISEDEQPKDDNINTFESSTQLDHDSDGDNEFSQSESDPVSEPSSSKVQDDVTGTSPKVDSLLFLKSASSINSVAGSLPKSGSKLAPLSSKPRVSLPPLSDLGKKKPEEKNSFEVFDDDDLDAQFSDFSDDSTGTPTTKLAKLDQEIKRIEAEHGLDDDDSLNLGKSTSSLRVDEPSISGELNRTDVIDLDDIPSFDSLSDFDDDFS
ncbi:hypothetical protein GEMRC1_006178 [Eukaryota sp. GEM-RC1]